MKISTLITTAVAGAFFLVSCGGSTANKAEENQEEITEKAAEHENHEHMDHDEVSAKLLSIPEGSKVFFANLQDGATVSSPLKIEFGVEGIEVEPAGELNEGKGHHHIIIDGSALEQGTVVPADDKNIHYGKGQTETEIELTAGEHTLTLQFADGFHQSYGPQLSATITVVVE